MRGSCIGMDCDLYGHIIGIYRRSGKRGERKMGAVNEGKRREGEKGSVRMPD